MDTSVLQSNDRVNLPSITRDEAEKVASTAPLGISALLQRAPNALERMLGDVNFPSRKSDGAFVGQGSFQIVFDRQFGRSEDRSSDEAADDVVISEIANWLYCEWSHEAADEGDRFIIASGTITAELAVEVTIAAMATIVDEKELRFDRSGKIGRSGDQYVKVCELDEDELVSALSSFRSCVANGATVYLRDLEEAA